MHNSDTRTAKSRVLMAIVICGALTSFAFGQQRWKGEDDGCGATRWMGNPEGAFNLEIKEQTIAPSKKLVIDGGRNGGVRIRGWERNEIQIRACVQSAGRDLAEAQLRTAAVSIETVNGVIRADAPADISFGASYDIRVPLSIDLVITTNNGGINLSNVRGRIEFNLKNGGAILDKVAGDVSGLTINGDLIFNLSGDKWDGNGINARTTNGNVLISIPDTYSARLETSSISRRFQVDFPIEETISPMKELNLNLGSGGSIVRATTVNGTVTIRRTAATKEVKK